jgi:hypothetical protein
MLPRWLIALLALMVALVSRVARVFQTCHKPAHIAPESPPARQTDDLGKVRPRDTPRRRIVDSTLLWCCGDAQGRAAGAVPHVSAGETHTPYPPPATAIAARRMPLNPHPCGFKAASVRTRLVLYLIIVKFFLGREFLHAWW